MITDNASGQICEDPSLVLMGRSKFIGFMDWKLDAFTPSPDPQTIHEGDYNTSMRKCNKPNIAH